MTVYIAEVGDPFDCAWWREVFANKADAYRAAWKVRNAKMNEYRGNSHWAIKFGYINFWVNVTPKTVIGA